MKKIEVKNFGPIEAGEIKFADITFLVGPQASGKSILLQLINLLIDKSKVKQTLKQYGYEWGNNDKENLNLYFGEGMNTIWNDKTKIRFNQKRITKEFLKKGRISANTVEQTLFYVPAQRVICLANGWPRFFMDYDAGTPFVLKDFSETLRRLMEDSIRGGRSNSIFPKSNLLKNSLRSSINRSIFHDGRIELDIANKKRFLLKVNNTKIPFMTWSAGQKEFMPLLLSLYSLCPPARVGRKNEIKFVIIEEPEMGLHPEAIKTILLQCIELIARGYKIIISTHSPVLLEFAWVIKYLQSTKAKAEHLFELFGTTKKQDLIGIFNTLLKEKEISTYFFELMDKKVRIKDISSLDVSHDDNAIANWGGLSDFASVASEIVAKFSSETEK